MKEPIIYFHRNGSPGMRFNLTPEKKKALNRKLRDENIRIAEERKRKGLAAVIASCVDLNTENSEQSTEIHLTPEQIRRKLRGGKRGTKEKR